MKAELKIPVAMVLVSAAALSASAKSKDNRKVDAPWGTETQVTNVCYLEGADLAAANDYRRQMCKLDFK